MQFDETSDENFIYYILKKHEKNQACEDEFIDLNFSNTLKEIRAETSIICQRQNNNNGDRLLNK